MNKLKQILAVVLILTNIFCSCKKRDDDNIKALPIITLTDIEVKSDNVIIKGIVESYYYSITNVFFEYGKTTDFEYSSPAEQNPIDGNTKTEVSLVLKNLEPATKYYFRIKAENQDGISYSNDYEFITENTGLVGTVEDIEGNVYETIGIGYQMWMAENLKTTKFNDGRDIPLVTDNVAWDSLSTPAYCWYGNDSKMHTQICGALYNWYAVENGKLCPNGWHVPTNSEWTELIDYFKESSTENSTITVWEVFDAGVFNEAGFSALPCGYRYDSGAFYDIEYYAYWWTATELDAHNEARYLVMSLIRNTIGTNRGNKKRGLSVRCIRDD